MSPAPWVSQGGWGSRWGSLRSAHPTLCAQETWCRVGHTTRSPPGTFPRGQQAEGTGAVPPARSHRRDVAVGQGCGAALREGAGAGKRGCKVLRLGSALCTALKAVISANGSFAGDIQIATTPFPLQISPSAGDKGSSAGTDPGRSRQPQQDARHGVCSAGVRKPGRGTKLPCARSRCSRAQGGGHGTPLLPHRPTAPGVGQPWGSRLRSSAFLTEKESVVFFYYLFCYYYFFFT